MLVNTDNILQEAMNANVGYQQAIKMVVDSVTKAYTNGLDPMASEAVADSMQSRAHLPFNQTWLDSSVFGNLYWRQRKESDVAPYGNAARDITLRKSFYVAGNDIPQGAVAAYIQKIQSTEWHIEGPERTAKAAQQLLMNADLGNGWSQFLARIITDWLTQDNGMFIELIGPGKPERAGNTIMRDPKNIPYLDASDPLTELPIGIAHLDSGRCWRTGDYEFPVLYYDLAGKIHKIHRTRIVFEADMTNPNERWRGRGFCAFSRSIAVAQTLINWAEMRNEMMDDLPPLGWMLWSGVNKGSLEQQIKEYEATRSSREEYVFRKIIDVYGMSADKEVKGQFIPVRQMWETFNERESYDVWTDIVSLSFSIDRQELMPLASRAMGSAQQSEVLQQKSRGKGIGTLLTAIERLINRILPSSLTFKFEFQDIEQDLQRAQVQQIQANTVVSLYQAKTGGKQPEPQLPATIQQKAADTPPGAPPEVLTPPAQSEQTDDDQPLITRDEARHLLAGYGIIDAEWVRPMTEDVAVDDTNDELGQQKAIHRYGMHVIVHKDGRVERTKPKSKLVVESASVKAAQDYLKQIGVLKSSEDQEEKFASDAQRRAFFGLLNHGGLSNQGGSDWPAMSPRRTGQGVISQGEDLSNPVNQPTKKLTPHDIVRNAINSESRHPISDVIAKHKIADASGKQQAIALGNLDTAIGQHISENDLGSLRGHYFSLQQEQSHINGLAGTILNQHYRNANKYGENTRPLSDKQLDVIARQMDDQVRGIRDVQDYRRRQANKSLDDAEQIGVLK